MPPSQKGNCWDAAAEEMRWRESLESGRKVQESLGGHLEKSSPDFNLLCLAELDAGTHLLRAEYFVSRAVFVTQLRRLIAEPTEPSRPVASIQAYRDSQKWWLESMLQVYEQGS